jgi:hypothetical protein
MRDDTIEAFGFPAIGRKKLTAAFDGGRITSNGGVLLLVDEIRQMVPRRKGWFGREAERPANATLSGGLLHTWSAYPCSAYTSARLLEGPPWRVLLRR